MGAEPLASPLDQVCFGKCAPKSKLEDVQGGHRLAGFQQDSVGHYELVHDDPKGRGLQCRASAPCSDDGMVEIARPKRNSNECHMKPLGHDAVVARLQPKEQFAQVARQFGGRTKRAKQSAGRKGRHGESSNNVSVSF
jgi:hypothetical protein